jgi:hypothetical protein
MQEIPIVSADHSVQLYRPRTMGRSRPRPRVTSCMQLPLGDKLQLATPTNPQKFVCVQRPPSLRALEADYTAPWRLAGE